MVKNLKELSDEILKYETSINNLKTYVLLMSKMKQYLLTHPYIQMKNAHTFPSSSSKPYHPSFQFFVTPSFLSQSAIVKLLIVT